MVELTRRQRFEEMMRRFCAMVPFADDLQARAALEQVMRAVEDQYSGVPENPDAHLAAVSDGRMYPPHDKFQISSDSPLIRAFRQKGHRTFFGTNGAVRIERLDRVAEADLAGADGKTIADLLSETKSEAD